MTSSAPCEFMAHFAGNLRSAQRSCTVADEAMSACNILPLHCVQPRHTDPDNQRCVVYLRLCQQITASRLFCASTSVSTSIRSIWGLGGAVEPGGSRQWQRCEGKCVSSWIAITLCASVVSLDATAAASGSANSCVSCACSQPILMPCLTRDHTLWLYTLGLSISKAPGSRAWLDG